MVLKCLAFGRLLSFLDLSKLIFQGSVQVLLVEVILANRPHHLDLQWLQSSLSQSLFSKNGLADLQGIIQLSQLGPPSLSPQQIAAHALTMLAAHDSLGNQTSIVKFHRTSCPLLVLQPAGCQREPQLGWFQGHYNWQVILHTLQGINISHLGKRKIIFKMPFWGDMLVPWRVSSLKLSYC